MGLKLNYLWLPVSTSKSILSLLGAFSIRTRLIDSRQSRYKVFELLLEKQKGPSWSL